MILAYFVLSKFFWLFIFFPDASEDEKNENSAAAKQLKKTAKEAKKATSDHDEGLSLKIITLVGCYLSVVELAQHP